jgi:hypothetical protein
VESARPSPSSSSAVTTPQRVEMVAIKVGDRVGMLAPGVEVTWELRIAGSSLDRV